MRDVADRLLSSARSHPGTETGGILIGYRESRSLTVTHAVEVPSSRPSHHSYVRSDVVAQEALAKFFSDRDPEDPSGYVGEWHSHPGRPGPSAMDRSVLRELASSVLAPVALVVVRPHHTPAFLGEVGIRRAGFAATVRSIVAIAQPPSEQQNKEGVRIDEKR